jgi:hypothetical protein
MIYSAFAIFLLILGKIPTVYSVVFYIYRSMSSSDRSWMYGPRLFNEYINWLDAFINFMKKDMVDNGRGFICCPCKHYKNEKKYRSADVLRTHLIKHGFKEDYRCWNKHGDVGLNEAEMREEVPTNGVEEEDDDVNEADILKLSDETSCLEWIT